jgi:hypothetical protein
MTSFVCGVCASNFVWVDFPSHSEGLFSNITFGGVLNDYYCVYR